MQWRLLKGGENRAHGGNFSSKALSVAARRAFESPISADARHFLTNLLARARYRFISFFSSYRRTVQPGRVDVRSAYCGRFVKRALILSCANHQPQESHALLPSPLGPACVVRQNAPVTRAQLATPWGVRRADLLLARASPCRRNVLPNPLSFAQGGIL